MHCWRGVLVHTIIILVQPVYTFIRWYFTSNYFTRTSSVWLAISAVVWIYIVNRITIPFFTSPLRHLPSPPGERFPIGHMRFHHDKPPTGYISDLLRSTPNDGIVVLWGPLYIFCQIIPTTPDVLLDMLNTHNYDWEKPPASKKFLRRTLGEGLVNVEGSQHKSMRRAVTPAFSGRHIRDLVPLFYAKGCAFADALAGEVKRSADRSVEFMGQVSRVTLDVIGAAGVGKDFNTINNDKDPLARLYAIITDTNRGSLVVFFWIQILIPEWIVKRMKGTIHARVAEAQTQLRVEARALMQEKKRMLQDKPEQQHDIISIILRSGDFSDDYLVDQLLTFLAAGHDTTASALTWACWLLSINPDIQDRLREECNVHLANKAESDIDASIFDTSNMPFLSSVCSETLRLYPTVPLTIRHAVKQTRIGDQIIPVGTSALISMWAINRDHDLWGSDADTFNPSRWLSGPNAANGGAATPYALLTFLLGPRSCIGQSFAFAEMKCLLAVLTMRFRFEMANLNDKVEVSGLVTIKPRDGLRLRLHDLKVDIEM